MKKTFLIVLLLIAYSTVQLAVAQQTNNCIRPITNFVFEQKKREISTQANEASKLNISKDLVKNNCLSSAQIKEVASLLPDDFMRLEFCKDAYDNAFDRQNFYEVYNTFSYFSTVFMLHDYVLMQRRNERNPNNPNNPTPNPNNNNNNMPNFPAYNYPNHLGYVGQKNCNTPLAENDFMFFARQVAPQIGDNNRLNKINEFLGNNCWSVAQIMRLTSLLDLEINRLNFLKRAYAFAFDIGNYNQATQNFSSMANQQDLLNFIKQQQSNSPNNPTNLNNCAVSNTDFEQMRNTVRRESFDNTKINITKQILRSNKCFTTAQIGEFIKLLSFDDGKLDIAQFAYDFCTDKNNYYTLNTLFSFSSTRDKFVNFLNSKK